MEHEIKIEKSFVYMYIYIYNDTKHFTENPIFMQTQTEKCTCFSSIMVLFKGLCNRDDAVIESCTDIDDLNKRAMELSTQMPIFKTPCDVDGQGDPYVRCVFVKS